MKILRDYVKFIFMQDVDIESGKAALVIRILSFLFAAFFSWGVFYLMYRYNVNIILRILLGGYASLGFFTTMPALTAQMKKEDKDLVDAISNFGIHNSPSILIAPIYLLNYCKKINRDLD
ncbi:hypothetical protein [Peptoniphilus sp.]|jgi:hypothetical protein|uniref:hypothetical protein n=1 Tax=Peptoniphilus sp. TaxID=1971214 RepID=UPI003D93F191